MRDIERVTVGTFIATSGEAYVQLTVRSEAGNGALVLLTESDHVSLSHLLATANERAAKINDERERCHRGD